MSQGSDVTLLTDEQLAEAVASTLRRSGFTVEELEAQARSGEFENERARLTWGILSDWRRSRSS